MRPAIVPGAIWGSSATIWVFMLLSTPADVGMHLLARWLRQRSGQRQPATPLSNGSAAGNADQTRLSPAKKASAV